MKLTTIFYLFLAGLLSYGCEDQEAMEGEVKKATSETCLESDFPLCFIYETLNEQGQPDKVFEEGENIILSFKVINRSDGDVFIKNQDFYYAHPDFTRIINSRGEEVAHLTDKIGTQDRGFETAPKRSALTFQISYYNDTSLVNAPWKGGDYLRHPAPEGPPLPPGDYTSAFAYRYLLSVEGQEDRIEVTIPLALNFQVK